MSCIPGETSFSYLTHQRKYLVASRKNLKKKDKLVLQESNHCLKETFPCLGERCLNVQCRTRKQLNHIPKVKRPSLAESIGPMVDPQGESFRTQTSCETGMQEK